MMKTILYWTVVKFWSTTYPGWGPRPKVDMSRPSQMEGADVQTLVRSILLVRSSCVQKSLWAYVQTIHDYPDYPNYSCGQSCLCPDYLAFKVAHFQTIVRSFVFPDGGILNAFCGLEISTFGLGLSTISCRIHLLR